METLSGPWWSLTSGFSSDAELSCFIHADLNQLFTEQSSCRWFEAPMCHQCDALYKSYDDDFSDDDDADDYDEDKKTTHYNMTV